MEKKLKSQAVTVAYKGKQVNITVSERLWTDGSMLMHVKGIIKDADKVAQLAYDQLVSEQKIVSSYVLIEAKRAAPVSGSFVEFLDYRSKDYQRIVRTEQKFQEWMAEKKVQA